MRRDKIKRGIKKTWIKEAWDKIKRGIKSRRIK